MIPGVKSAYQENLWSEYANRASIITFFTFEPSNMQEDLEHSSVMQQEPQEDFSVMQQEDSSNGQQKPQEDSFIVEEDGSAIVEENDSVNLEEHDHPVLKGNDRPVLEENDRPVLEDDDPSALKNEDSSVMKEEDTLVSLSIQQKDYSVKQRKGSSSASQPPCKSKGIFKMLFTGDAFELSEGLEKMTAVRKAWKVP